VRRAHKIEPASVAELDAIAHAMPERLQLAVLLGGWLALRYGEIAELRRKDIDVRRGVSECAAG
jgi:integrase